MVAETTLIILYRVMVAYLLGLLVWNLLRSRDWKEQLLAAIVIIPFILRLLHIK